MNRFALTLLAVAAISIAGCGSEDDTAATAFNACSNTKDILNLPFSYSLAESRALSPGYIDNTESTYVHFAPFGAHFQPMTEVAYGNGKTTFAGFFSENNTEIIELPPGSGVFGFYAGVTPAEILHERRPMYYSPSAATITSIRYDGATAGLYLDDEPTWTITLSFGDIKMKLEHVGKFSPILHDFIADPAGTLKIDTDTYSGPIGDIFPNGYLISAPNGIELAYPQVVASAVPGNPGYYNGAGSEFPNRPHVKMQFSVTAPTSNGNTEICALKLLSAGLQSGFQNILNHDIVDANSQRFAGWQDTAWQWRAESSACLSCSTLTSGLNGLYKDFGGWFERGDNSTVRDELLAFIPVQQSTASYDATLYVHDVQTEWLITRRKNNSLTFDWTMEDTSIVSTDNPTGEIVAVEADALLVLWRDLGVATDTDAYQWLRYDVTGGLVTIKFGDFSDLEVNAMKPNFDLGVDIANDDDVITLGKTKIAGF